jgi:hypothetical protein
VASTIDTFLIRHYEHNGSWYHLSFLQAGECGLYDRCRREKFPKRHIDRYWYSGTAVQRYSGAAYLIPGTAIDTFFKERIEGGLGFGTLVV